MKLKITQFALLMSLVNLLCYHLPFFSYVFNRTGTGLESVIFCILLAIFLFVTNFLLLLPISFLSAKLSKFLVIILFNINAVAFYFMHTYSVVLSRAMINNIFNTNLDEATGLFSISAVVYWLIFGVIPSIVIFKIKLTPIRIKAFFIQILIAILVFASVGYGTFLQWEGFFNRNQKMLGGLLLPWSYVINTPRYFKEHKKSQKQILLPNASLKNNEKSLFVLVIGESSSRANYSLYGYQKDTNPQLAKINNLVPYYAQSCDTNTIAGVKCILEYKPTNEYYEPLPSYLYRTGVDVIWRTVNDGEPKLKITEYQNQPYLAKKCQGKNCAYDEVILSDLEKQIADSKADKMLLVLHLNPSHGTRYDKKYPPEFEKFTPVCHQNPKSCDKKPLTNSYDNTIVYTDYLLAELIHKLEKINDRKVAMLYVSDHGESLGENGVYLHGTEMDIAPKRQYQVPFMVWTSDNARKPKLDYSVKNGLQEGETGLSQHNVFHSVLDFLAVDSPIFDKEKSVFLEKN